MRRFLVEQVFVSTQLIDVVAATKEDARALALGLKRAGHVVSRTRYASGQRHAERVWEAPAEHLAAHPVNEDGSPIGPPGNGLLGRRPGRPSA